MDVRPRFKNGLISIGALVLLGWSACGGTSSGNRGRDGGGGTSGGGGSDGGGGAPGDVQQEVAGDPVDDKTFIRDANAETVAGDGGLCDTSSIGVAHMGCADLDHPAETLSKGRFCDEFLICVKDAAGAAVAMKEFPTLSCVRVDRFDHDVCQFGEMECEHRGPNSLQITFDEEKWNQLCRAIAPLPQPVKGLCRIFI